MNSKFDDLYGKLNTDQKKAVDTIDGPVLVIAGPGTGKTQVLAVRIANILKQTDTNPSSILCLTFQDASVVAMKKRLQSFIGYDAFKVNINTFHSFCSEIIQSFPHEFDFDGEVQTIKEVDKLSIFREILTINKLISLQQRNDILGNFKSLVSSISSLKKEFISPEELQKRIFLYENSFDEKEKKLNERKIEKMYDLQIFYSQYLKIMREKNLIDFDDMIYKVTENFSHNDVLVKYFQEQYLYTLVDEFQDTNNAQMQLIKSVASFEDLEANIFAVGDDDQTIFRFQGASSDNFKEFINIFPKTEIIVLHTNYRSGQEVIDSATNVIKNNPNRVSEHDYFKELGLNKEFTSGLKRKSLTEIHSFEHSLHEDFWIGTKIQELKNKETKLNEIAIISRTNRQIVTITKFLDKFAIPYIIRRSESILENKYIKNLLQIFEIINDPLKLKDDRMMWQVLSQEFLGLNNFDVFALVHDAKEQKTNMYDFLTKTHLPKYEKILTFINTIIALQAYSLNNNFLNSFTKTAHTLSIVKFLETLPESYAEMNRLSSLFQYASTRAKFDKNYSLGKFLEETTLMQEKNIPIVGDPIDVEAENKINILTAHSSKGLEFDYVFIYQGVESKWEKNQGGRETIVIPPLAVSSLTPSKEVKELEKLETEIDERRLFYVAMTRAKKDLYLTFSKRYYDSDSGEVDTNEKIMSKFLAESGIFDVIPHNEMVSRHEDIVKIMLAEEELVEIPERNKEYLNNLVQKKLSMSASKLNKYENCHYKFLLEDVFVLPIQKNLNLEIGTAIHKGIEVLTKSYNGKEFIPFEKVLEAATSEFNLNIDKDQIVREELGSVDVAYDEIKRALSAYYDYFALNPEKPQNTEFMTGGIFEEIKLRGRIDKVSQRINGTLNGAKENLVITDYKTSSHTPTVTEFLGLTKSSDKNHLRQLLFYRLLTENSDNALGRKFGENLHSLKIEYINTKEGEVKVFELPKKGIFEYKPRSNSKKTEDFDLDVEYEHFKNELKRAFESIKNLDFKRTADRKICQNCFFKTHCGR